MTEIPISGYFAALLALGVLVWVATGSFITAAHVCTAAALVLTLVFLIAAARNLRR